MIALVSSVYMGELLAKEVFCPMYTLDTNAIIYYLKNDAQVVDQLRGILSQDVPIYISTITEIE